MTCSPVRSLTLGFLISALLAAACGTAEKRSAEPRSTRYEDLLSLFSEWRNFQKPKIVDDVPDYSASVMAAQQRDLETYRRRLDGIDPKGWTIHQQVDYHVVRAEMNGLDFDHRVLKPWANNPGFYVTVFWDESDQPAREGPFASGGVELWACTFPLSAEEASRMRPAIRAIPGLLEQARANLVGNKRDLWIFGTKEVRQQSAGLARLAWQLADSSAELKADVEKARAATESFAGWLESQAPSKTAPSGVGIDNYDWYLKNVQLAPYTWREEVALMESELARAGAFLALEERRNASLPEQVPIADAGEHGRRFKAAVTEYMRFLAEHDVLTIRDYMDAALRARIGAFSPGPREFFTEVDYRDPVVMRTHGYHWFEKKQMAAAPHPDPIRRGPLLYNIFDTRTEGLATGWEEMMMLAGMFDARPRSRELIYVLLAERAARALGELRMHNREFTLEQAAAFASANTPRGWLSLDGNLVRSEQHLYLQQPGYGTSYLIGKTELEKLLSERRRQMGGEFTLRRFTDELEAAGLVPAALLRWELTGEMPPDVAHMLGAGGGPTRP
jgi:hypothetical protein